MSPIINVVTKSTLRALVGRCGSSMVTEGRKICSSALTKLSDTKGNSCNSVRQFSSRYEDWKKRNVKNYKSPSMPPPLKPGEKPDEFEDIVYRIHFVKIDNLGYRTKLAALYMQATEGPNNTPEPPKEDKLERAYWLGWKQLGDMTKEEARKEYIAEAKLRLTPRDPDIIINN